MKLTMFFPGFFPKQNHDYPESIEGQSWFNYVLSCVNLFWYSHYTRNDSRVNTLVYIPWE